MSEDFPDTRWSRLLELRDPAHPRRAEHLEGLARLYWRPVYHYIRALRPAAEAEDLAQQFFALLLDRGDLERLSPDRGSFRGFLRTAARNFVAGAARAEGVRARFLRSEEAEWREPERPLSPEEAFDREWARGVLVDAVAALRRELEAEGKAGLFALFREVCLEDREVSYDDAARVRGLSADDVRNRLRELRLRLRGLLRARLLDYLGPAGDVEAELRFVLSK